MKLFLFRGGIHPEGRKELSVDKAIERAPLPEVLHIPLQQHVGVPAEPVVEAGEYVRKGQLIGRANGVISASVHAPTSGEIIGVGGHTAPHPSGLPVRTITLRPDGKEEWDILPPPLDAMNETSQGIARRVEWAGIVGMGGAAFPSAVKLNLQEKYPLHTLIINGAECEPYLTSDDRLMRERAREVIDGVRIMHHALKVKRAIIAVETNKPRALSELRIAATPFHGIDVLGVPAQYPMGSERHLVHVVTGRETPSKGLTADIGVVVHNVGTAYAVHEAVRHGRPLISRIVTISGRAVREPRNIEALIGTPISHLIAFCGGLTEEPDKLMIGGPMMGQPLPSTDVPVIKGCNAVLALTAEETARGKAMPCIRCGVCVDVCPCGLVPLDMAALIRKEDLSAADGIGLNDCLSCGSCSYACPSHIPLVQYFNYAKGRMKIVEVEKQQQEVHKRLSEQRAVRLEREMQKKKEMLAQRKAEAEARRKAKEAAAGETSSDAPATAAAGTPTPTPPLKPVNEDAVRKTGHGPAEPPVEDISERASGS
ncbi:MAG: electron transport complex subunit RsxC [Rhodospirillales bacterium]|nr:electron transport complex subunit RsxC [Rhodospirillales bacterium]MCW8862584.1 electron transport complex subunit RsxC [Rhodospirillales bacterium]